MKEIEKKIAYRFEIILESDNITGQNFSNKESELNHFSYKESELNHFSYKESELNHLAGIGKTYIWYIYLS